MLQSHSLLFRWACRLIKLLFLVTVGLVGTCLLATIFGHGERALALMQAVYLWWLRLALSSGLVWSCAVMVESLR
ncbi:hypothetical protein [Nodosilinea sp. P-1105]|uniref:hypothetical protein n=1 Tax=Nodosilinea sp. P-1105 TaxID=2546229 RepID=UPI001469D4B2|nr:hypothetical protein [Nodosilinea sp. P-1105]NMF84892.1 hypothetical protein [Nodosilinea sp. P-1105]